MTPLVAKATAFVPELAAYYKWFDLSGMDFTPTESQNHMDNMITLSMGKLPFERCAVTGIDLNNNQFVMLMECTPHEEFQEEWKLRVANFFEGEIQYCPVFSIHPRDPRNSEGIELYYEDLKKYKDHKGAHKLCEISIALLCLFLKELDKKALVVGQPTASTNNAKRIRQGKKPLFEWTTVTIEPRSAKNESLGGTHASPRLHDVRGHWVVRNGNKFWRRAHKRGDASKGVIFHDYVVKPAVERRVG